MLNSFTLTLLFIAIGFIIFIAVGEYLFLDLTGLGKRKAHREFPQIVHKLGFAEKEDEILETWQGTYEDYKVRITPSDDANIIIDIAEINGLEEIATVTSDINFDTNNIEFDTLFKNRLASPKLALIITNSMLFQNKSIDFVQKWQRKLDYLEIRHDTIYCSLRYGSSSYIPAKIIVEILPDLTGLAKAIQTDLQH